MAKFKLSAPWVMFYNEIKALFGRDPEIEVVYDEEDNDIRLYVENTEKAEALQELLPAERKFGNITVTVTVIPANKLRAKKASLFRKALQGNPAFVLEQTVEGVFTNPVSYIVFAREVVQYWIDDLGDLHGIYSTLYEDIARDVFEDPDGVFFCTEAGEELFEEEYDPDVF